MANIGRNNRNKFKLRKAIKKSTLFGEDKTPEQMLGSPIGNPMFRAFPNKKRKKKRRLLDIFRRGPQFTDPIVKDPPIVDEPDGLYIPPGVELGGDFSGLEMYDGKWDSDSDEEFDISYNPDTSPLYKNVKGSPQRFQQAPPRRRP